ncbi:FitA-like ribbon-helix-helix domain-containing protein [Parvularcula maris]|uniref:Antitoxin FitA-like ribbon-helix-helix domain-containing protein n=1 Tax=Parvularcula maris TaxID=2965077 RepID=A0A9X2RK53_9PROT|nr:hypothetical protein [Parvularcula maris]MCQ8185418.1 hypothetical protein [Parvularcula maris]
MANINVRGLSDETKSALRVKAAKAGLSLEAFAREALRREALREPDEAPSLADMAERYFGGENGVELELPPRESRRGEADFS